jgi:hypothetical protein
MKINLSIKLGIAAGLVNCIAWYMYAKQLGFYAIEVYVYRNYTTLALLLLGILLLAFLERRKNAGFLEFKDALRKGMFYSLIVAVIIATFNYIYYTYITPDTIDYFLSEAKKAAVAHDLKGDDLQKFLDGERNNFTSFKLVPPVLFFGLISSLLAGAIFSKKNPNLVNLN